ncbi:MAG: hypothetical protein IEMM0006_2137 [bacterium]|nr:MAG: hypothetical protein IEMM0006_2137 [bacterium]
MRLTQQEIKHIKETVYSLDPEAKIHLFGSRTDDHLKGGDIDLLILSKTLRLKEKLKIRYLLKEKLGNRKIDIVVTPQPSTAFISHAYNKSLLL